MNVTYLESNKWSAAGFLKNFLFLGNVYYLGAKSQHITMVHGKSIFTYTFIDMYMYTKRQN